MTAPTTVATATTPTVNFGDTLTRSQRLTYVLMLGALVALGPFTIDLYLPAFPSVAADLATSDAAVQLTLTATTIGFGLGQLIVGPLSDAMGRRRPLLIATSVHIVASIGVAMAPISGVGHGGPHPAGHGRRRRRSGGHGGGARSLRWAATHRMLSRLALVMGFAPVFAPVIGSQLLRFVEWRGVFVFLAAYGLW